MTHNILLLLFLLSFTTVVNSHKHHKDSRLKFDVSEIRIEDKLIDGELWIYRNNEMSHLPTNWTYDVTVYQVHKVRGERKKITKVTSKQLTDDDWGWIVFNVTSALEDWTKGHTENHGFFVKVTSSVLGK